MSVMMETFDLRELLCCLFPIISCTCVALCMHLEESSGNTGKNSFYACGFAHCRIKLNNINKKWERWVSRSRVLCECIMNSTKKSLSFVLSACLHGLLIFRTFYPTQDKRKFVLIEVMENRKEHNEREEKDKSKSNAIRRCWDQF